jgi:CBS domain-containing protein
METDEPILRARDLMQRDIISVRPETPILDVHRLFVEEEIHGAPVIGRNDKIEGVITTLDLVRVMRDELESGAGPTVSTYFRDEAPYSAAEVATITEDLKDRIDELAARDAMSRELVTVEPETPIHEVARVMTEQHVHRVLVVSSRGLEGVLTTFDLLRAISRPIASAPHATGYSR